jgi:HAD superfamily hydrolase (TIGR01549 family)
MEKVKYIVFDFDGVIVDSMALRDEGFKEIFKEYSSEHINDLLYYHRINGGLSRYVKIRYFFEEILKKEISEQEVKKFARDFSSIMRDKLTDKSILIDETVDFIKENHKKYPMHIVSGSDGKELNFLCKKLGIHNFFLSITGSPTPKNTLVSELLNSFKYKKEETTLIGDSINDYEAAAANGISFIGYNNENLQALPASYLKTFSQIYLVL